MSKTRYLKIAIFTFIIFLVYSLPAIAADYKVELKKNSRLWIEGGSTMHDYEAEARVIKVDAVLSIKGESHSEKELIEALVNNPNPDNFTITIPVKKLKSPTFGLSGEMHKALNKKECPEIIFTLKNYQAEATDKQNIYNVSVSGPLLVTCESNEIILNSTLEIKDDHIVLSGEQKILMSNYGVKPPVLLFFKTNDEVMIKWNLKLGIKQ